MNAILNITLPIFLLISLGFASLRFGLFTREQISGIGQFLLRIGLPVLVFNAISSRPLREVIQPTYLIGYTLASVLTFFIIYRCCIRIGLPQKLSALNGIGSGFSNSGFVGYPLLIMASDAHTAGQFFAMNVLTENVIMLPLLFILLDWDKTRGNIAGSLRPIALNLLRNPIIIALILGLPFGLGFIQLPVFAQKTFGMLANSTAPLALFVIGASLYGLKIRGNGLHMFITTTGKILLMPTLAYICLWLLNAPRDVLMIGTLLACTPSPSLYALLGRQYQFESETASVLFLTTICSFIPMALVLAWWH